MTMTFLKTTSLISVLLGFIYGCAGEPVADNPGVCSISCSEAKLAGGRETTRIRLATESFSFTCLDGMFSSADQQVALFPYPVSVRFIVESNTDGVPYKSPFVGTDTEEETQEDVPEDTGGTSTVETGWTPVPNISFDVVQSGGGLNPCGTDPENGVPNDACDTEAGGLKTGVEFSQASVNPPDYGGIVTPKSEWCSDTCGIMTINVWPVCYRGSVNPIALQVRSGGLFSTSVNINVNHTVSTTSSGSESNPAEDGTNTSFWEAIGDGDTKRISDSLYLHVH